MPVLCELHATAAFSLIVAFFAYFSKVRISNISTKIGIFDGNFNVICVSITYFY